LATLKPLQHKQLRSSLSTYLFDAVLKGELRPGERIVEGKLARQLGVSQGSLREALHELEHQSLVTKHGNRGTFVTKLTIEEIINDIYMTRQQLEPLAAFLAQKRMTPENSARLEALLERMSFATEKRDLVELSKSDLSFHQLIWRLSGNRALEKALNVICLPLFAFDLIHLYSAPTYDYQKALNEHYELLEALKSPDPDKVKLLFQEMMNVFRSQDLQNLKSVDTKPGSKPSMVEVLSMQAEAT
jgi:DNA-binding GntR family transcriptional regulator